MQQVTEEFEVRVSIGRLGGVSFNALFCGRPAIGDVVAAINHKRQTAKVFKLAPPELFIEAVKRIGVPEPNHAMYHTDGCCVHVITVELFPVQSGETPKQNSTPALQLGTCCLCNNRPEYRPNGNNGMMLFHSCLANPGGQHWFDDPDDWANRNAKLRQQYEG